MKEKEKEMSLKDGLLMLLLSPLIYIWSGFCFTKLWSWFLEEVTGFTFTIPLAIGVLIFRSFLFRVKTDNKKSEWVKLGTSVIYSLVCLGFGFIAQLFI